MLNRDLSFADVLMGQAPGGTSGGVPQGMQKAASEAAMAEVFGGFTKEAEEEIVNTMGAAGAAFAEGVREVLAQEREELAKVAGVLVDCIEKIAEMTSGTAPLTSEGFPTVSRDGIGSSAGETQSKAEMSVNHELSGKGWTGNPGVTAVRERLQEARVLSNANVEAGGKQDNPGVENTPIPVGSKISSVGARLKALLSKGMGKAKGAVGSGVKSVHGKMGLNPINRRSFRLDRAKSTGEMAREIGGAAKERAMGFAKKHKKPLAAGAAAGAAGAGAYAMRQKRSSVDESIGANLRQALFKLSQGEE